MKKKIYFSRCGDINLVEMWENTEVFARVKCNEWSSRINTSSNSNT